MENEIRERLVHEVKKHRHLHDPSSRHYEDPKLCYESWQEIGNTLEKDAHLCCAEWDNLSREYMTIKKRTLNGDSLGDSSLKILMLLSWMSPDAGRIDSDNVTSSATQEETRRRTRKGSVGRGCITGRDASKAKLKDYNSDDNFPFSDEDEKESLGLKWKHRATDSQGRLPTCEEASERSKRGPKLPPPTERELLETIESLKEAITKRRVSTTPKPREKNVLNVNDDVSEISDLTTDSDLSEYEMKGTGKAARKRKGATSTPGKKRSTVANARVAPAKSTKTISPGKAPPRGSRQPAAAELQLEQQIKNIKAAIKQQRVKAAAKATSIPGVHDVSDLSDLSMTDSDANNAEEETTLLSKKQEVNLGGSQ